jgi:anti-sigma B factor antagonist
MPPWFPEVLDLDRTQMMAAPAKILVNPIRDVTVVTFQDNSILDTTKIEAIGQELYELVEKKDRRKLVLDFSNVRFLSSSALGVLITLRNKADTVKGKVILCGLKKDLRKVFEITRLDKLFTFVTTEEKALAQFGISTS